MRRWPAPRWQGISSPALSFSSLRRRLPLDCFSLPTRRRLGSSSSSSSFWVRAPPLPCRRSVVATIAFAASALLSSPAAAAAAAPATVASSLRLAAAPSFRLSSSSCSSSSCSFGAASPGRRVPPPLDGADRRRLGRRGLQLSSSPGFSSRTPMTMMPEGPEVRALVDRLQPAVGRRLVRIEFLSGRYHRDWTRSVGEAREDEEEGGGGNSERRSSGSGSSNDNKPPGYGPDFFNRTVVSSWGCKGKFMYVQLRKEEEDEEGGGGGGEGDDRLLSLWITLGMTGKFLNEAAHRSAVQRQREQQATSLRRNPRPPASTTATTGTATATTARWFLEFQDPNATTARGEESDGDRGTRPALSRIYYHDPRGFGTLKFCRSRAELLRKLSSLGPDLLDGATAAEDFVRAASSCRPATNVCRFLMDQTKVSGIGNYLLAEGLYKARVDPFCSLRELNRTRLEDLFQALRDTAADSYRSQAAAARQGEEGGGASFELCCYGRDRCLLRNDPVRKEAPGPHGRTIWYTDAQLFVPRDQRTSGGGSGRRHDPTTAAATATTTTSRSSKRALAVGAFEGAALAIKQGKGSVAGGEAAGSASSAESVPSPGDWLVKGLREDSWREQLAPHLASESFRGLAQFLRDEYRSVAVYPLPSEVFAALNLVPLDRVRVVVVGQDPYHGPGQAHGLAFSVPRGVKRLPPSLRNILAELQDDVGMSDPPSSGCLTPWAERGVLLLNTVLTVRAGEPLSHASRGWEEFTDAVLEAVATYHSDRGVVFLLWGNPAHAKARSVLAVAPRASAAPSSHAVIKTSHPSPLAATKTSSPFLGSRCFSRANAALIERSYDPIDWSLS